MSVAAFVVTVLRNGLPIGEADGLNLQLANIADFYDHFTVGDNTTTDVADILIDLARRETKTYSVQFARGLIGQLRRAARLHKEPLKSAGFRVLRAPDVPSVLLELGYVSNKQDLQALTSQAWRSRTADAIAQAVDAFFTTQLAGSGRD